MTVDKKLTRVLELKVEVDAQAEAVWKALTEGPGLANWFAPIASVTAPGAGAEVTVSWGGDMAMTTKVDAWEPGKHVRWLDESQFMGPGTVITVEFFLATAGGKTQVRLVQSGFGESEGWDDFFEGTETGWTYFLYNLRLYVERHLGKVRHMISTRFPVSAPRDVVWKHLLSATAGLVIAGGAVKAGDLVQVKLGEREAMRAMVALVIEGHALALRINDLDDAALFIELEGGKDTFHIGCWLSVYDEQKALNIETPAQRAFERIRSTLR